MEQDNNLEFCKMSDREILRFQLEQLAEVSKDCLPEELPEITSAMIELAAYLDNNRDTKKHNS